MTQSGPTHRMTVERRFVRHNPFFSWCRNLPWAIVTAFVALMFLGWLGIARSDTLAENSGRLLRRQSVWMAMSLLIALFITLPNYRRLCRLSYAIFALSLVLLVTVYFFPPIHGAQRWIRIGQFSCQPSELAKVAFVLALARYLMYRENYRRPWGLLVPLILTLIPLLLILREPDLGTAALFLPIFLSILYAAGARRRDLILVLGLVLLVMPLLWTQMSHEQRSRVTALLHPASPSKPPHQDTYHLYQAKQAMALGGLWGSFIGGGHGGKIPGCRVPAASTDSIFAILGERYGLLGMAIVLLLYIFLAWRGVLVAEATREPFGRLVAAGVVSLICVQVVINTAMMVGLLPITGLSLPMVSYGGSGLVTQAIAIGLLLNISLRPGYELTCEPFRYR